MLRIIRLCVAVVVFAAAALFFLDFSETLPNRLSFVERIQFIPAVLAGSAAILAALILATLLFGRLYCSIICPLGILQDLLGRAGRLFHKKKKRFSYQPPRTRTRLLFFALAVILGVFSAGWLGVLDPYAIFGRTMNACLSPIWRFANNLLADQGAAFGENRLYRVDYVWTSGATLSLAFGTALFVAFFAVRFGRLYCNSVCPVGAFLGFLSRFAFFKIRIDRGECVSCGQCSGRCKASCIDVKKKKIDASRCVVCFDCLRDCPKNGIGWHSPFWRKSDEKSPAPVEKIGSADFSSRQNETKSDGSAPSKSKRLFLTTLLTGAAALCGVKRRAKAAEVPAISYNGNVRYERKYAISPPGSGSHEHFQAHCVSCHLCVAKCPSNTLAPSFLEYGPAGILQPTLKFDRGFCNFDCRVCGEVCPTGAIRLLTPDEKKVEQIGRVEFIRENCVVVTDGTSCGACAEHCPTQAVHMVPHDGALTIPEVNPDLCVGCGACESICPVRPYRAVHVEGLPVHGKATPPPEEKKEEIQLDDFGF